jgi:carboxyl-terminal processing protease
MKTMRKGSGHPTTVMIAILIMVSSISIAQVPDDINGRLWRLCKVWGFAKYYHENNCNVNWNEVMLDAIDSTLLSTSNASFNENLSEMLNGIGPVSHADSSLIIEADTNLNAHFDWMDDQVFSQDVQAVLDSIQINFRPRENCLVKFNDSSYSGLEVG